jgi:hypothetical protein
MASTVPQRREDPPGSLLHTLTFAQARSASRRSCSAAPERPATFVFVTSHAHDQASGASLNRVAASATIHCLTGCAIGEVLGMVIGTAAGFGDWLTIGLAVALAFVFGFSLTMVPLLRAGLGLAAALPLALAADTVSIAVMEVVDNAIMLGIPGAMEAGLDSMRFWGSLAFALLVAGFAAYPVNRAMIARGRGHAVVHEHHHAH